VSATATIRRGYDCHYHCNYHSHYHGHDLAKVCIAILSHLQLRFKFTSSGRGGFFDYLNLGIAPVESSIPQFLVTDVLMTWIVVSLYIFENKVLQHDLESTKTKRGRARSPGHWFLPWREYGVGGSGEI